MDLDAVARECAPTFTGADLYALCADAWMAALKRTMALVRAPPTWSRGLTPTLPTAMPGCCGCFKGILHAGKGVHRQPAAMQAEQLGEDASEVEDVRVGQGDFWSALQELRPSLSLEELARYQQIRAQYERRA